MAGGSRIGVVIALAVACRGGSKPADPVSTGPAAPAAVEPQAYVLGSGVARDYRRAAALYAERCADGCGDLAACRSLYELVVDSRGMVPRLEHVGVLMRMCRRGDVLGCALASLMGVADKDAVGPDRLPGDCALGDASACHVELMFAYVDGTGAFDEPVPPEVRHARLERRMDNAASKQCRRGIARACRIMVENETWYCREHMPGTDCVAEVSAARRAERIDPAPLDFAWKQVQASCSAGDADACALIPGRAILPRVLCDAGDYVRCAELGEHGDAHAAELACKAGIGARCTPPGPASGTAGAVVDTVKRLAGDCDTRHDATACKTLAAMRSPSACP